MAKARRTVVLGFLGTQLDRGKGPARWESWRPTVDLCRHEDLLVDRLDLLASPRHAALARQVVADIATVSPETEVRLHDFPLDDAWDFEEVYGALHDLASAYPFTTDREDYLVHVTPGPTSPRSASSS